MRRRIVITLCAVSLMLCAVMGALWARSHSEGDFLNYSKDNGTAGFVEIGIYSIRGSFHLGWVLSGATAPSYGLEWNHYAISDVRVQYDHWGFGFVYQPKSGSTAANGEIWCPFWLLILLFALPPLLVLRDDARKRRRRAAGACLHCGYDLRGSSGRCPECGHEIPSAEATGAPGEFQTPQAVESTAVKTPSAPEK